MAGSCHRRGALGLAAAALLVSCAAQAPQNQLGNHANGGSKVTGVTLGGGGSSSDHGGSGGPTLDLNWLTDVDGEAVCNDGSPAGAPLVPGCPAPPPCWQPWAANTPWPHHSPFSDACASSSGYYFAPSPSGSNEWLVYLPGVRLVSFYFFSSYPSPVLKPLTVQQHAAKANATRCTQGMWCW